MINIFIAIALVVIYTVTLCIIGGRIPNSLSQSVFMIPPKWSWVWTATIGSVAALIMPTMLEKAGDNWKFLAFLACAGLLFVAFCPLSSKKDKSAPSYKAHMIGAWTCAIASQLLIIVTCHPIIIWWMPWLFAFEWMTRDHDWPQKVFWAELTCFASTFTLCLS
jgi:hypothetical protein